MNYTTWKKSFENEFEQHRQKNTKIIYSYQTGYDYYLDSPEWIMYGDFCNFIRRGTEHIGPQITAKYENIMIENNNIFQGFIHDEFRRIKPFTEVDETLNKVFEYNNMNITLPELTTEQKRIFNEEKKLFKKEYEDYIKLFENHNKIKEVLWW